eukprot:CAMPEP_0183333862 /NCGR_PEP_ID=MMETSP0164_2-20130417/2636_1 /TAXON_ID=221442 /ORGANISM="Coccolithus pelagicus ssp braarudi, Strain PLY182g" /LENGTH=64 /DNA_ID=CAMNT_0025502883 /DNA_START=560 /DNA_END=755 /DNA_ORIENTATION=-
MRTHLQPPLPTESSEDGGLSLCRLLHYVAADAAVRLVRENARDDAPSAVFALCGFLDRKPVSAA